MEHPENNGKPKDHKSKIKFKIMSLKVKGGTEYAPELVSLSMLFRGLLNLNLFGVEDYWKWVPRWLI